MKKLILLIFFCPAAFALDAVVTVLETPMLKSKSLDAPVVQYLRKGDVIKIFPGVNDKRYDHLAPTPEKMAKIREQLKREQGEDPYFKGQVADYQEGDEFIPTLDRQGHRVYVIASHLYVYHENENELTQKVARKDPTDYRLQEPLAKNYPFKTVSGYRSQVLLGMLQPFAEVYPYTGKMVVRDRMRPVDFNLTFMRRMEKDKQDRLYYGLTLRTIYFQNSYTFNDGIKADEKLFRLGIGPTMAFDLWRTHKDVINLSGTMNFYPLNQLSVKQTTATGTEGRLYRTYSFAPRFGLQYHRKSILEEIDFVGGMAIDIEPPTTYSTREGASEVAHWNKTGTDNFSTKTLLNFGIYLGFQSAY